MVIDLGMGLGKAALQMYLQLRDVECVVGVELCASR